VLGPVTSRFPSYNGGELWRVLRVGDAVKRHLDGTALRSNPRARRRRPRAAEGDRDDARDLASRSPSSRTGSYAG
jgi:hypothetical protein